jgi:lambda repressor-like predicted transcriptional regulator
MTMGFSLREAAEAAGLSKSSIHRAVARGRLSAARLEGGAFEIDPSELARAFPPRRVRDGQLGRHGTAAETAETAGTRVTLARLEAENVSLKTLLDAEKRRGEELRSERDEWRDQAKRLALPAPVPAPAPATSVPTVPPALSLWDLIRRLLAAGSRGRDA